jgi:antitoxin component of MazEF toxin-antitoxin module
LVAKELKIVARYELAVVRIRQYTVMQHGNGLAIRIPPEYAEDHGINAKDSMDLLADTETGDLIIRKPFGSEAPDKVEVV